jgi:hypothetical protein
LFRWAQQHVVAGNGAAGIYVILDYFVALPLQLVHLLEQRSKIVVVPRRILLEFYIFILGSGIAKKMEITVPMPEAIVAYATASSKGVVISEMFFRKINLFHSLLLRLSTIEAKSVRMLFNCNVKLLNISMPTSLELMKFL